MKHLPNILHEAFKAEPYWWDAAPPEVADDALPTRVDYAIVGSGYCGLSAATLLAASGAKVVVLDGSALGSGASTRSGGMVSSGQKLVVGGAIKGVPAAEFADMIRDSIASFDHLKELIAGEGLDADLQLTGRFFGAHAPRQFERLQSMGRILHEKTGVTVHEIPRARQREVVGTDYFHGGILVDDYGGLHPGKYHRALRGRARSAGAILRLHARVETIEGRRSAFRLRTSRGDIVAGEVLVTTNGYTDAAVPQLRRRVIPARSYQIATEPLEPALMDELIPRRRMVSDTKHELYYTRPSPDGTRILFGTRPGALQVSDAAAVPALYRKMTALWPQLHGRRITHAWSGFVAMTFDRTAHIGESDGIHYALGCNGNGVALMTYLGHRLALKLLHQEHARCAFERPSFPTHPLYHGTPWFVPLVSGYYHLRDSLDRAWTG
jgi:glycine/D-amino acid oxidase-like deaminating enzyme